MSEDEGSSLTCLVCASPVLNAAVGDCGHVVCVSCSHRMRQLYRRLSCVVCKVENKHVAVVPVAECQAGVTTASSLRDAAATNGTAVYHDSASNIFFFDEALRRRLQLIAGFTCPKHVEALSVDGCNEETHGGVCRAPVHRNIGALRMHAREQHRSVFCDVCVSSKVEYKSRLPLYPLDANGNGKRSAKLVEHMKKEHPMCRFCGLHLLDDDELFSHLQKNHECCHICERGGRSHQYFRNFASLEAHYRSHHFVCEDPACRGVVFGSILDLQAHMLQRHRENLPRNARGRRMQVDISELHAQSAAVSAPSRGGRGGNGAAAPPTPAPTFMSDEDVAQEQARQAERHASLRRGFNSNRVVFSADDSSGTPSGVGDSSRSMSASSGAPTSSSSSTADQNTTPSNLPSPDTIAARRGRQRGTGRNGGVSTVGSGGTAAPEGSDVGRNATGRGAGGGDGALASSGAQESPDDGAFYERSSPESPEETMARNKKLVSAMRSALDAAEFEQFRSYSGDFRHQRISGEEFYDAAVEAFGVRRAVRDVLPELVALLPNPSMKQELAQVCLRRNPPPLDSSSRGPQRHAPPPVVAHPDLSRNGVPGPSDGFPSLGGSSSSSGAVPARQPGRIPVVPPTKNDFPRLGKVTKAEGPPAAVATGKTQAAQRAQASSSGPSSASRQSTASVLMQPSMNRVFGASPNLGISRAAPLAESAFPALGGGTGPASTPSRSGTASGSAQMPGERPQGISRGAPLAESAFPALGRGSGLVSAPSRSGMNTGGVSAQTPGTRPEVEAAAEVFPALASSGSSGPSSSWASSSANAGVARGGPTSAPAPDVSDRAGAVWGGAATRGGKKRGPGRGGNVNGPVDSDPPRKVVGEFPSITPARPDAGRAGVGGGASSGAKVVDVAAMAKSRQAKSALPRVAGGGSYGFAWDRKKARSKQREVKREVKAQAESAARSSSGTSRADLSSSYRPEAIPTVEAVAETMGDVSVSQVEPAVANADGESNKNSFDQFSYLHSGGSSGVGDGDPSASFFDT